MRLKTFWNPALRQSLAFAALSAILTTTLIFDAAAQKSVKTKTTASGATRTLTEEQRALHVLNRLGYGARPGDVERVRAMGIGRYIEQQLDAGKINDQLAESKLQNIEVLGLSTAEIFARYPNGAAIAQIVANRNGLERRQVRGDLKTQRQADRAKDNPETAMENNGAMSGAMENSREMPEGDQMMSKPDQNGDAINPEQRRELQRQAVALYREYGYRRPAEINQQLTAARLLRAVYSERQLHETMVDFWSNHFNVYVGKGAVRWHLPSYERDALRPNALGNFRDLLAATAKHPAMLFYLDNHQSVAPNAGQNNRRNNQRFNRQERLMRNGGEMTERAKERLRDRGLTEEQIEKRAQRRQEAAQMGNQQPNQTPPKQQRNRRGINENYARELMELHTLGVDGGYTQKDIGEVARAFTGWTIADPRGYRDLAAKQAGAMENRAIRGINRLAGVPEDIESGTFYFNERWHDANEKTVLGQKIAEGGGMEDGLKVIDILTKHPATAKFIARKLTVKFVNDNPSEVLVNRVANAFQKSNGDIKTTLRAIFTSPEFFAVENYRAKIKTPFEVVASSIRTLGAETNASPALQGLLAKMGEPLYGYQAPTGYPDTAEDWVNTGALLERLNFGLALSSNRIPGTKVLLDRLANTKVNGREAKLNQFVNVVLNGEISPNTKATLLKQLEQPLPEPRAAEVANDNEEMIGEMMRGGNGGGKRGMNRPARLMQPSGDPETFKIVGLILGSPEFQRQ